MLKTCVLAVLFSFAFAAAGASPHAAEIEEFNRDFAAATRAMNNESVLALWEDDGISLLPSTPPIVGKKAIAEFLTSVMKDLAGARMETFDLQCRDLLVDGDLATEWCTEHQVVRLADKSTFDGRGKMLLVLHRGAGGKWRIEREMWNQAAAPAETK